METPYQSARDFHQIFDPRIPASPTAFTSETAAFRAGFKIEELVEFLYAASENDPATFETLITQLHQNIETAKNKVLAKGEAVTDPLVGQVDALTDLLYFTYGSFALLDVDPAPIYQIVHAANLGKLFPDGKPHYDPVTNKVLKPDTWARQFAPEPKIAAELKRQKKLSQPTEMQKKSDDK